MPSQDLVVDRTLIAIIEPVRRSRTLTYRYEPVTIEAVPIPDKRGAPLVIQVAWIFTLMAMFAGAVWANVAMVEQLLGMRPLW